MHNLPKGKSSSDSSLSKLKSGKKGKGSPKTSGDKQEDSAEDSLETAEQLCSLSNKIAAEKKNPPVNSSINNSAQNLRPVFEFEDVSDQILLNDEDIQGIISLRLERDGVNGDTPTEILQNLNPKVVLEDVCKDK